MKLSGAPAAGNASTINARVEIRMAAMLAGRDDIQKNKRRRTSRSGGVWIH
jgi:hypothetical protein